MGNGIKCDLSILCSFYNKPNLKVSQYSQPLNTHSINTQQYNLFSLYFYTFPHNKPISIIRLERAKGFGSAFIQDRF